MPLTYNRIVIKLGTNLITGGGSDLDRHVMARLVEEMAYLRQRGLDMVLVSSGAVAAGRYRLGDPKKRRDIPFKQVLAAVGQTRLMQAYDQLFTACGVTIAQTLLTKVDILNRLGYLNARNTLLALLELGVIPIINENDVVAIDELAGAAFGDNDNLSAMVANLVDADLLVMLSDVGGLYTANPRRYSKAEIIPRVETIDRSIECLAEGSCGELGTGGMVTKIEAARLATASGTAVVIADGRDLNVISKLVDGQLLGTFFPPAATRIESRKRWMLSLPTKGKIGIDAGAQRALMEYNKSLLAAGITEVEGDFERGDVIEITDRDGSRLARGLSDYSSVDIVRIKGRHSGSISEILGYEYGSEVVHRDNLVAI